MELAFDDKANFLGGKGSGGRHTLKAGFGDTITLLADQKSGVGAPFRICAGDVGVQALNPMHKALVDQKVERAIGHGRLSAVTTATQSFKDGVGPHPCDTPGPQRSLAHEYALSRPGTP